MLVVPEVLEARIQCDLVPLGNHLVEDVVEGVLVLEVAGGDRLPGALAQVTVLALEETLHLGHRSRLALEVAGHRAHDLAVLLVEERQFRLDRDVFVAEELHTRPNASQQDVVAIMVELGRVR